MYAVLPALPLRTIPLYSSPPDVDDDWTEPVMATIPWGQMQTFVVSDCRNGGLPITESEALCRRISPCQSAARAHSLPHVFFGDTSFFGRDYRKNASSHSHQTSYQRILYGPLTQTEVAIVVLQPCGGNTADLAVSNLERAVFKHTQTVVVCGFTTPRFQLYYLR
jgi:hypothetical protein